MRPPIPPLAAALALLLAAGCGHASKTAGAGGAATGSGGTATTGGTGGTGGAGTGGAGGAGAGGTGGAGGAASGCPGLPPIAEPSEQLYVAPTGKDTATGTQADPLASLGEAAKRFPGGGTVIVRGGTYGAQRLAPAGTATHPLVIRAAQGESPVFDGAALTKAYDAVLHLASATSVVLEGLEVRNGTAAADLAGIESDVPVSNLTVRGCKIHDVTGSLGRFAGDAITFEGNELYNGALENQNNPPAYHGGGWPTCMGTMPDFTKPTAPWATNVVIRGNHVHDCWGEGIGIWFGSHVEIADNVVERTFNVGIYLDDASSVRIERNFVHLVAPMSTSGAAGRAVLMGVEPYTSTGVSYAPDHDVAIVDNVLVAGGGVGWWTSTNASPANTYAALTVLHNTVIAEGSALGFAALPAGASLPAGCQVIDNVFVEKSASYSGNAKALSLAGNAWVNEPKPAIAGATDVSETLTVGPVNAATDAEPLASQVGTGGVSGVPTDFLCAPRSAAAPTRGAFEH